MHWYLKALTNVQVYFTFTHVFPRAKVSFGGRDEIAPHLWGQIFQTKIFWGGCECLTHEILNLAYYRNNCMSAIWKKAKIRSSLKPAPTRPRKTRPDSLK